jgi:hypothetical protein
MDRMGPTFQIIIINPRILFCGNRGAAKIVSGIGIDVAAEVNPHDDETGGQK